MSWETKTDYAGLAVANKLIAKASNLNKTGQYIEKHGQNGDYVATKAFGLRSAPTTEYVVADDISLTTIALGTVTTVDGKKYALESISFSTGADQEPTFTATSAEVASSASTKNKFVVPTLSLSPDQIAQIPFTAFTVGGTSCELTGCSGEISCKVGTNDKNGDPLAHDVTNGHITLTLTIAQYGETAPTVTPATGWDMSAPHTVNDPDSDFPEWTCTLSKPLTKTMASAA